MGRRVCIVAGEYSAGPRHLPPERRRREFFAGPHPPPAPAEIARAFFRFPNHGDDGRTRPEDWEQAFGIREPVRLLDLLASAAHRALTTLHELVGGDYRRVCESITHLLPTSLPPLHPTDPLNIPPLPHP